MKSEEDSGTGRGALLGDLKALQEMLTRLRQDEFASKIDKVLVYAQSAVKSQDRKTAANFIRFADRNLDAALFQALEAMIYRPRQASRSDEARKALALKSAFDGLPSPADAMLEHYRSSSDPLNKYLVIGPWGHEYLIGRGVDLEEFDRSIIELLGFKDTPAGRIVLGYAALRRAVDGIGKRIAASFI